MSDFEAIAAAIHEFRRRKAPLTISLGYYDLDPEDQAVLLAMVDDVIAALGIPAATLRGLRDGSLVAVSVKDLRALANNTACVDACPCWQRLRNRAETMLAAAQEPPR